jgi:hypothetical protein
LATLLSLNSQKLIFYWAEYPPANL